MSEIVGWLGFAAVWLVIVILALAFGAVTKHADWIGGQLFRRRRARHR